jgi:hypothetical protein
MAMEIYPRAYLAMGNGDLVQVTNWNFVYTNNAKMKSTLRRQNSGVTRGNTEGTLKFDMEVPASGPERDYFMLVQSCEIKQIRAKLPGGIVRVLDGAFQELAEDQPMDDAFKVSMTFICGAKKGS